MLINVYLPCENVINNVSLDSLKLQLCHIENLSELYPGAHIIIGGNLNVDFTRRSAHSQSLSEYLCNSSLIHCSQIANYCVDYTYNFDNTRFSILDHFILSPTLASSPDMYIKVEHDIDNTSDHDPIFIKIPLLVERLCTTPCRPDRKFAWYKCNDNNLQEYRSRMSSFVSSIDLPINALVCTDVMCNDSNHSSALQEYFDTIYACCLNAAQGCIPMTGKPNDAARRIPGWSNSVQPLKDKALMWHRIWTEIGRPHEGIVAQIRRSTRANYHRAIRSVIKEEADIVKNKLAQSLLSNSHRDYWSEIKKFKRHNKNIPTVIDDARDPADIVNVFVSSYKTLFSAVSSPTEDLDNIRRDIDDKLRNDSAGGLFLVTFDDIVKAVKRLKHGKQDGESLVSSDFLIYAHESLYVHLALLISALFNHGIVLKSLGASTIVPLPKGKHNLCDSSNYRGIALSSILGKVIDLILLDRLADNLITSDLQFGFKKGLSTSMCTMVIKETIAYYTSNESNVYCVMLDATKAFDRVNYAKLFPKLFERKIPLIVIRYLFQLYTKQETRIKWDTTVSDLFPIHNGVRQGAISSPIIFCLYIDGLLNRLENANIGCCIGNVFFGALCYADDLTLLAPTPYAMRKMIQICNDYASEHDVVFNANKSKCILFVPQGKRMPEPDLRPKFFVNNTVIEYVESWPHLGNILSQNQNDSACIVLRRDQLIGQLNEVLCTFGKLGYAVKIDLIYRYCSSFYGSVLWNLGHAEIERLCAAWRTALRRIFRLPYNSHSNLLFALCSKIPVFDELCKRVMNFHFTCLKSTNSAVRFICHHSMFDAPARSPHGRNLLYLSSRYKLDLCAFKNPDNRSDILNTFNIYCLNSLSGFDECRLSVLYELLMLRDNVITFDGDANFLDKDDVDSLIVCLSTE